MYFVKTLSSAEEAQGEEAEFACHPLEKVKIVFREKDRSAFVCRGSKAIRPGVF